MGANSPRKMSCRDQVLSGGSHAPNSVYAYPYERLPARRGLPADPLETPRSRSQVPCRTVADSPVLRRSTDHLGVRRVQAAAGGTLGRGRTPRPVGDAPRLRRLATAAQRGLGGPPAQSPPQAVPTRGHRPDPDPVPRPTPARSRGDLPQQTQEWHQSLPCLRHCLRHPQAPPLHRGPDRRPQRRADGGRAPTPAAASGTGRGPAPPAAAGSRLLQRGRDPLPAGGAPPVPDASDLPGTQARRPARPQWDQCLPELEAERLGRVHPPRCAEADRQGLDLCQVPLLPRAMAATWNPKAGVCFLGPEATVVRLGASDVSVAVRDRDDLPADAPGADSDLDAQPGVATAVRGGGAGAAEHVGVVSLSGVGPATAWRPEDLPGVAAVSDDAVVVGACGRSNPGYTRHGPCLSAVVIKSYESRPLAGRVGTTEFRVPWRPDLAAFRNRAISASVRKSLPRPSTACFCFIGGSLFTLRASAARSSAP